MTVIVMTTVIKMIGNDYDSYDNDVGGSNDDDN